MTDLVQTALDFGFSHAGVMKPAKLQVREEVRLMCAADRCQAFNRSWGCPPASGSLADNRHTHWPPTAAGSSFRRPAP